MSAFAILTPEAHRIEIQLREGGDLSAETLAENADALATSLSSRELHQLWASVVHAHARRLSAEEAQSDETGEDTVFIRRLPPATPELPVAPSFELDLNPPRHTDTVDVMGFDH